MTSRPSSGAKRTKAIGFCSCSAPKDCSRKHSPGVRCRSQEQGCDGKAANSTVVVRVPNTPDAGASASDIAGGSSARSTHLPSGSGSHSTAPMDQTSIDVVNEAFNLLQLRVAQPSCQSAPKRKLVDSRFLLHPFKLNFIVTKRCQALWDVGLGLRLDPERRTIQEFLDQTQSERAGNTSGKENVVGQRKEASEGGNRLSRNLRGASSLPLVRRNVDGSSVEVEEKASGDSSTEDGDDPDTKKRSYDDGALSDGGQNDGGQGNTISGEEGGGGSSVNACRFFQNMTLVYNATLGWIFLHQATEEATARVRDIINDAFFEEMGIPAFAMTKNNQMALKGMVELFNDSPKVAVLLEAAIVKIAGTKEGVAKASKAIESLTRSAERVDEAHATWYWRGDPIPEQGGLYPTYPMTPDVCYHLDRAYSGYLQNGMFSVGMFAVDGVVFHADFTTMLQQNTRTGFKRPIQRLVPHRAEIPLLRCPKEMISLSSYEDNEKVEFFIASEEDQKLVTRAVAQSMTEEILRIESIWNPFLWGHYAQNAKTIGNEMLLFHGAGPSAVIQICKSGFDKRLAGSENGTVFGEGCYFARDASLAYKYMRAAGGHQLVVAKVLVGKYAEGSRSMKRPPKMYTIGDRLYDSTVNTYQLPTVYVTYKDWQAYPVFIVTFRSRS